MSAGLEVGLAGNEGDDEGEDEQNDDHDDPALGVFPAHVALQLDGSSPKLCGTREKNNARESKGQKGGRVQPYTVVLQRLVSARRIGLLQASIGAKQGKECGRAEDILGVEARGRFYELFDALSAFQNFVQVLDHLLLDVLNLTAYHLNLVLRACGI